MKEKTIIIEVYQGLVSEVKNLPKGWTYEIIDLDEHREKTDFKEGRVKV
jgi:hypothetical protein